MLTYSSNWQVCKFQVYSSLFQKTLESSALFSVSLFCRSVLLQEIERCVCLQEPNANTVHLSGKKERREQTWNVVSQLLIILCVPAAAEDAWRAVWVCRTIRRLSSRLICFISFALSNLEEKSDKVAPSCVFTSKVTDDNVPTMFPPRQARSDFWGRRAIRSSAVTQWATVSGSSHKLDFVKVI